MSVVRLPRIQIDLITQFYLDGVTVDRDFVAAAQQCVSIVNCAGKTGGKGDPASFSLLNEHLPAMLYTMAKQAGCDSFLHIGSVAAAMSVTPRGRALPDDAKPQPDGTYGRSKLAGDTRLLAVQDDAVRLVILRVPVIYGRHCGGIFRLFSTLATYGVPLPLARLPNKRDFLFVGNLADAIGAAINTPSLQGCFFVTDAPPLTPGEIYDAIGLISRGRKLAWPAPPGLVRAAIMALRPALADSLTADAVYDSSRFRALTGWRPPFTLQESLSSTLARE